MVEGGVIGAQCITVYTPGRARVEMCPMAVDLMVTTPCGKYHCGGLIWSRVYLRLAL